MSTITVIKRDHNGEDVLRYDGTVLSRDETVICLDAPFGIDEVVRDYATLRRGDIFREWFYTNRWYNVFRVSDRADGHLKGFYCNLTRPAIFTENAIASDDLALDMFVQPDSTIWMLDEDEYAALLLSNAEKTAVVSAIAEIRRLIETRAEMFADLTPHHRDE
ncbi:MAG: DUF402 domain-containing protein [Aggregatilineales bacterium]